MVDFVFCNIKFHTSCMISRCHLQVLNMWKKKTGVMNVKTFTDHVAQWVEGGFVQKEVWKRLALPPNIDTEAITTNTAGTIVPLNREEIEVECKI